MKSFFTIAATLLLSLAFLSTGSAFAPKSLVTPSLTRTQTEVHMVFNDEKERPVITRDSEPEEYFQT